MPPSRNPALNVLAAVAVGLGDGQQDPVGTLTGSIDANPLPGTELDRQHADLGVRPVQGLLQGISRGRCGLQHDLVIAHRPGKADSTGDQRRPYTVLPILASHHHERLPAEELGELRRDERLNHAADPIRDFLDADSPLNGALALVEPIYVQRHRRSSPSAVYRPTVRTPNADIKVHQRLRPRLTPPRSRHSDPLPTCPGSLPTGCADFPPVALSLCRP